MTLLVSFLTGSFPRARVYDVIYDLVAIKKDLDFREFNAEVVMGRIFAPILTMNRPFQRVDVLATMEGVGPKAATCLRS